MPSASGSSATNTQDILGDSNGNRGIETPMGDLVADAILWGTQAPENGGAQIAFMNIGGVRASLTVAPKYTEGAGQITYKESYDVAPFGNLLTTSTFTGAQIQAVLEQQYIVGRPGGRDALALGVSNGFTYAWDATQPAGSRVVPGSMKLNGTPIDLAAQLPRRHDQLPRRTGVTRSAPSPRAPTCSVAARTSPTWWPTSSPTRASRARPTA